MTYQAEDTGANLKNNIKDDMKSATAEMAGAAKGKAEAGKEQAANKLSDLSDVIDQVADSICENDKLGLASFVRTASDQLSSLASKLQERSMDELAEEAKDLARRRPTAFMLGSVAVGFGLSRFVKASTHHSTSDYRGSRSQNYPPAADFAATQNIKSYADPASPYATSAER
jgi:hypothetical protein